MQYWSVVVWTPLIFWCIASGSPIPPSLLLSVYLAHYEFQNIYIKKSKFWKRGVFNIYRARRVIEILKHGGYKATLIPLVVAPRVFNYQ